MSVRLPRRRALNCSWNISVVSKEEGVWGSMEKAMGMGMGPSTSGVGASNVVLRTLCIAITVLSLALPTFSATAYPGCAADLGNKVTKFQTTNLKCKIYSFPTTNPYVIWALKDNATQVVTMVVSAPLIPGRYAGLGFSADGQMIGGTALIATLTSSGAPTVNVYSLNDKSLDGVVANNSGLTFVGGPPEAVYDQGRTVYISFQLDFAKHTSKNRFLLMALGQLNRDGTLAYHEEQRIYFTAEFVSGVVAGESVASKLDKRGKIHGSLQILGWGLLLPVGALIARYARGFDPTWFYFHAAFQLLGFACVVAGVVTGIELAQDLQPDQLAAHRGLGLFLFVLAILQVLAVFARPRKDAKVRKYWNWYHAWLGRLALFLAVVNIFLGLNIAKSEQDFKLGYIAILAIEFLAFIILEVLLWRRWSGQPPANQPPPTPNPNQPGFQYGGSV